MLTVVLSEEGSKFRSSLICFGSAAQGLVVTNIMLSSVFSLAFILDGLAFVFDGRFP